VTPEELKSIRHHLGLTQRQLGEALGYREKDASTVRRWEYGARAIPPVVALLLRYMAKYGLPDSAL
jgi:transcriptional regulator with XRE-family HTH domain